jgi:hypothetical protein
MPRQPFLPADRWWVEAGSRLGRGRADKAESPKSWGTDLVVSSLEGDRWQNSVRYGVYSDRFSPPILGWAVKSEI